MGRVYGDAGKIMYNWKKDIVTVVAAKTLYISIVFSWMLKDAEAIAKKFKGKIIVGGPAAKTHADEIKWAEVQDDCWFEPLLFHNPLATFTSRGCIRKCPFCVVSKVEGEFRELKSWRPAPIICDNNLTAASKKHFEKVIESVKHFPYVDINQGMDARLFTKWHAQQLQKLKGVKIRFAFDALAIESKVKNAVDLARSMGFRDFGCYVLIGFNDTPEEAKYKLETVCKWKIDPTPMRFQPWNTKKRNDHIAKGWTDILLQDMTRYYGRLSQWRSVADLESYRDYRHGKKAKGFFDDL